MSMQQIKDLRSVKITTIMRRKSFVVGFRDARERKPFNYDYGQSMREQWDYERGRLLATFYGGRLKDGHALIPLAVTACRQAFDEGVIF